MKGNIVVVFHEFKQYFKTKGLADQSKRRYETELNKIIKYCFTNKIKNVKEFDVEFIKGFTAFINNNDTALKTKELTISVLKSLIEYCYDREYLLSNPFDKVKVSLKGIVTERKVFDEDQIKIFLESIYEDNFVHARDRSIFELMYGTGMRVNELVLLNLEDVDPDHNEILIKHGKGDKQRIVPLYGKAFSSMMNWLKYYRIKKVREEEKAVYISLQGKRIRYGAILRNFKEYLKKCNLGDKGFVLHSIRHSCATHLLDHGADIRYVQELLGHESIETTGVYTKQEKTKLKKLHKMFHPRENELYEE